MCNYYAIHQYSRHSICPLLSGGIQKEQVGITIKNNGLVSTKYYNFQISKPVFIAIIIEFQIAQVEFIDASQTQVFIYHGRAVTQ